MSIAFALAGLGGFNAHGAGFLAAAGKWGVMPELVSVYHFFGDPALKLR